MTAPMKAIAALLTADNILINLDVANKDQLFLAVIDCLKDRPGLSELQLIDHLKAREKLGSTALGAGVAVPHARVTGLSQALAVYVRPRAPIPFEAPDGKPVVHVVVIFVPEHATHAHLRLLAGVSELFQDSRFKEKLSACNDALSVSQLFSEWAE